MAMQQMLLLRQYLTRSQSLVMQHGRLLLCLHNSSSFSNSSSRMYCTSVSPRQHQCRAQVLWLCNQRAVGLAFIASRQCLFAAYGSDAPTLQPAYQPLQSQQHLSTRAAPATMSDGHWESLAEMSSAIRHDVDQFLMALPLGTGPDDAAVEEAVQSKLFEALLSKAVMQHKLTDWCAICPLPV